MIKRYNPSEDVKPYVADLSRQLAGNAPLSKLMSGQETETVISFIPPRLTTAERDALVGPTAGTIIYNTSTGKLNVYTTGWEAVTSA